jgi:hypothetical protein
MTMQKFWKDLSIITECPSKVQLITNSDTAWIILFPFVFFFFFWRNSQQWAMTSPFTRFLDHTQRRTTVGRTPLDEWSARHRDLYLTTHNNHNRQDIHVPGGIRTHNLSSRAVADLHLRPRGHWDRLPGVLSNLLMFSHLMRCEIWGCRRAVYEDLSVYRCYIVRASRQGFATEMKAWPSAELLVLI